MSSPKSPPTTTIPVHPSSHSAIPPSSQSPSSPIPQSPISPSEIHIDDEPDHPPNGGYGWVIVISCATLNFFFSGFSGSWGVIQAALVQNHHSTPSSTDTANVHVSTAAWIGSLSLALVVGTGTLSVRLLPLLGVRNTTLLGTAIFGLGVFVSGFTTGKIGGLFVTSGVLTGLGTSAMFVVTNAVPTQWFDVGDSGGGVEGGRSGKRGKLGLANGIVKLGGGVGAAVWSVALGGLIGKVGLGWAFRIYGLTALAIMLGAAMVMRGRLERREFRVWDMGLFNERGYAAVFVAGAIFVFSIYVPPFFLPLYAQGQGYSSGVGAGILAGFNLAAAIGRFVGGPMCDWIGPFNTLLGTLVLNAVSMLAIWPVSVNVGVLALFAVTNGLANGAFFTSVLTVATSIIGYRRAATSMSMITTGWTPGYLLGTPIAGYLLTATRESGSSSIDSYRPMIFYAGGIAACTALVVCYARLQVNRAIMVWI